MGLRLILVLFLTNIMVTASGQQEMSGKLSLTADLSSTQRQPHKVLIEKTNLGRYERKTDTVFITGPEFSYQTTLDEPGFIKVTFYWPEKKLSSISFLGIPSAYQLSINKDHQPVMSTVVPSAIETQINALEKQVAGYESRSDSLVRSISYEHKKITAVEKEISFIRDSMENVIDGQLYKKFILEHLNTAAGLYALCKYGDRPLGNSRITAQPEQVESLFNQLDKSISQLPSAQTLLKKLSLGRELTIGKPIKDLSLPDTAGRYVKISDYKGQYLLVDFWASWCLPCRAGHPLLLKIYRKYKNSGFQILSISQDELKAKVAWKQAIQEDSLNLWPQLSDFNHLAQKAFDIQYVPSNYLIDPKGIIIAKDLRGDALEKQLKKIFE